MTSVPTIGDATRRDVPTCAPAEKVENARDRVRAAGWGVCVVVNKGRVVLGLLREKELSSDPETTVERVMRSGPTTFRPDVLAGEIAKRMLERGARTVLATTSDRRLVGLLYRDDAERLAGE